MDKRIELLLALLFGGWVAYGQGTAFTYQGRLNDQGGSAGGAYDLRFQVYDSGSNVVAGPLTNSAVWVTNGLFAATLDFGGTIFNGSQRWLELGVRRHEFSDAFTVLTPLQPLTAMPYAIHALTSDDAIIALQVATNQVSAYSNNIAPLLAAVKSGGAMANHPFITLSPHGIADQASSVSNCGMMFGIDTPGTVTGGLQEAANAIAAAATISMGRPVVKS